MNYVENSDTLSSTQNPGVCRGFRMSERVAARHVTHLSAEIKGREARERPLRDGVILVGTVRHDVTWHHRNAVVAMVQVWCFRVAGREETPGRLPPTSPRPQGGAFDIGSVRFSDGGNDMSTVIGKIEAISSSFTWEEFSGSIPVRPTKIMTNHRSEDGIPTVRIKHRPAASRDADRRISRNPVAVAAEGEGRQYVRLPCSRTPPRSTSSRTASTTSTQSCSPTG